VPEIDKDALRESIINAFCHRDYHEYDSVNIAVFKDRIEIRNPGRLMGGLTINKIIRGNVSKRRNEVIAEMFNKVHFVERWGRGIELILSKEPEAKFKDIAGMFVTVFRRRYLEQRGVERVGEGLSEGLSEGLKLTLIFVKNNPGIKAKEISIQTSRPIKTIERHIKQLIQLNIIERRGSRKTGGYWEVKR
jgi:ATP-dependent DNA helicase RecG